MVDSKLKIRSIGVACKLGRKRKSQSIEVIHKAHVVEISTPCYALSFPVRIVCAYTDLTPCVDPNSGRISQMDTKYMRPHFVSSISAHTHIYLTYLATTGGLLME